MCPRAFEQVPVGQRLHPGGDLQHDVDQRADLHQPDRHGLFYYPFLSKIMPKDQSLISEPFEIRTGQQSK
jgi:hypothetical protein